MILVRLSIILSTKFSLKDFFSKWFVRISTHLLTKFLMENFFFFCSVSERYVEASRFEILTKLKKNECKISHLFFSFEMIPSLSNKAVISEYFIFIFFVLFSEYFIIFYFLKVTAGPFWRIFNDLTYTYWLD